MAACSPRNETMALPKNSTCATWDELFFDYCGKLVETAAFSHLGAIRRIKVDDAVTHIPEGLRFRIKLDYFSGTACYGFKSSGSFNRVGMLWYRSAAGGCSRLAQNPGSEIMFVGTIRETYLHGRVRQPQF